MNRFQIAVVCAVVAAARAIHEKAPEFANGRTGWYYTEGECGSWHGGCDGSERDGYLIGVETGDALSAQDSENLNERIDKALAVLTSGKVDRKAHSVEFESIPDLDNTLVRQAIAAGYVIAPDGFDWKTWEPEGVAVA